ncbi:two-component system OmpR family sensor kinase/two-component system sensor histidine kinase QseC [Variovorax beijingensis]|uniref:histidine kinase n=1 Tax=Variovorax beijingensis TaxID=2496117 RepID=A0A561CIP0_9BURK|nr:MULTISPECIES: HAMP domain-containing sensor histidine kinase [Variovorax]MBD9666744.1 HAMP domain-containing histidine kinase [Variovorax sp. VRV01]MDP9965744.1 two-component system OmpR family sensor kinase/two-component system sensor histidine kinase QseC [Variovorax paradoxus]MDR6452864.1 two-component system OmpR family sensor kinase/two-component system sensor histidine kinase QseC [Variovorax paradoxus]TWD90900.1 two-component system OmpR family sensor kinase/two-component system senso
MTSVRGGRWWRPRSLRTQLLFWLVTLHLVAAALTAWFTFVAYGDLVHNALDEQMRLVADSYAGSDPPRTPRPLDGNAALVRGAFVVQLWSADGRTLRASSWPPLAVVPLQPRPGFSDARADAPTPSRWRVFTAEAGPRADQPRVQVLQNEDYRRRRALRRALLEGLPIALLLPLALLILWLIVSAASRSLRAVARDVASQDERSPTELSLARVPDEIAPLVQAFNHLLSRMRSAFATQRRFVQDAAHELRTPMAAIGLQIENLRAHVPAGEATERFNQLEAGVTRAQHLIEQLLSLSRQDAPGRPLAPSREAVDIETLLRESVSQLMVLADARRVDIGFEGSIAPVVQAPAAELRSVFDNLIDNALRYAPEGGVVDVRLHEVDGHAVVDVLDNGPGIPASSIGRVFDRFFRVPGAPAGGSGLGLAIARTAAERHGLRIELRNRDEAEGGGGPGLLARVHLPPAATAATAPLTPG